MKLNEDRAVSDAELRQALADENNQRLIRSVTRTYARQLSEEQLENCGMHAVWRTLRKHRHDHPSGQKFTSSLYRFVHWECKKELGRVRGRRKMTSLEVAPEPTCRAPREEIAELLSCLEQLPDQQQTLLRQYYLSEMSLEKVGQLHGVSIETARLLIGRAERELRCLMEDEEARGNGELRPYRFGRVK